MKTVLISFIYLAVSLLILIFARFIFKKFVKYDLTEEAKSCNATAIVPYGGFLFGMVFIILFNFLLILGKLDSLFTTRFFTFPFSEFNLLL